jgi:hypothetical protein
MSGWETDPNRRRRRGDTWRPTTRFARFVTHHGIERSVDLTVNDMCPRTVHDLGPLVQGPLRLRAKLSFSTGDFLCSSQFSKGVVR